MNSDHVYFIKPIGFTGPVKIGCSQDVKRRRGQLARLCPFPLEIIAEIEGGRELERRFHALFALRHKQREWFDWSPDMARVVSEINAGTLDLDTLPPPQSLPTKRGGKRSGTPTPARAPERAA
jgi:hypothetical protein